MMNCEKCLESHDGSFGSGRFCSLSCARSFAASVNRERVNKILSQKLKGRKQPVGHLGLFKKGDGRRHGIDNTRDISQLAWNDLRKIEKRRRILQEQNGRCLWCRGYDWRGEKLTLELDHINGNNKNDVRENLRFLCPNCHSQTPTFRNRKR